MSHWVAYDLAQPSKAHVVIHDARELEDHRAYGWTIEGPFVHADQLTEAVRDRDALATMLKRLLDVALVDGYGEIVRDEAEVLLNTIGGQ